MELLHILVRVMHVITVKTHKTGRRRKMKTIDGKMKGGYHNAKN